MTPTCPAACILALLLLSSPAAGQDAVPSPQGGRPGANVVVILSDDAGWADFSMQGGADARAFATPRIDSLARDGVRFARGYVAASVCSPSRAALLTGRYPQRFGHEFNIPPRYSEENGLPVEEQTVADALLALGYRTIGLGKWHLGYAPRFHPLERGFSDWYGFLQGSRSYWPIEGNRLNQLLVDREPVTEEGRFEYMTDELSRGAAEYIARHRAEPFFIYLAFNAVHGPMHARPEDLAAVEAEGLEKKRAKLAGMTRALDRAVGRVLDALSEHDLEDETLVFFLNDNGGATNNASVNLPLRGHKGTPFEGGLRVPFLARWPGVLPAGLVYEQAVCATDVLPTALAAAGSAPGPESSLDGVDLLPFLTGERSGAPHEWLFWRRGESWAVSSGPWKLLQYTGSKASLAAPEPRLYHLGEDPGEQHDLAGERPEELKRLRAAHDAWAAELTPPLWD